VRIGLTTTELESGCVPGTSRLRLEVTLRASFALMVAIHDNFDLVNFEIYSWRWSANTSIMNSRQKKEPLSYYCICGPSETNELSVGVM